MLLRWIQTHDQLYRRILWSVALAALAQSLWLAPRLPLGAAVLAAFVGVLSFGLSVAQWSLARAFASHRAFEQGCASVMGFAPPMAALMLFLYPHPSFYHSVGNAAAVGLIAAAGGALYVWNADADRRAGEPAAAPDASRR